MPALSILLKLSILLFVPTASMIYWKYRSGAAWNCALAALTAFALYNIVRPHLDTYLFHNPFFMHADIRLGPALTWHAFALGIIYGAIRAAFHWLVIQTKFSKMKAWRDAVLFALAYTTTDYVLDASIYVSRGLSHLGLDESIIPVVGYEGTRLEAIWALRELPLDQILENMNEYIKLGN